MYRVVDWHRHFENNRSREIKKLEWVPFPNKHDGDGYTELLAHKNGPSHYGAWCALVQVASKCDPRGTLVRDGARAHDCASLSRMTHFPAALLGDAIDRLVREIKWLEIIPDPELAQGVSIASQECAATPHEGASSRVRAEWKGMEGNGREEKESAASPHLPAALDTDDFREAWSDWVRHRSEIRKPLKPTMVAHQIKDLVAMGHDRAIASLRFTIAKGWQGIREPDRQHGPRSSHHEEIQLP